MLLMIFFFYSIVMTSDTFYECVYNIMILILYKKYFEIAS